MKTKTAEKILFKHLKKVNPDKYRLDNVNKEWIRSLDFYNASIAAMTEFADQDSGDIAIAKLAFMAAREGRIEKIPVLIDQYGGVNIEEHFVPNKYASFDDWFNEFSLLSK